MAKAAEKPASDKDPFNLHYRTEKVFDWLLSDWESDPKMKNRQDAIKIIQYGGGFLTRNVKLRDSEDVTNAGSAVARYSGAFRTKTPNGLSGAKGNSRPTKPALAYSDTDDDSDSDDAA